MRLIGPHLALRVKITTLVALVTLLTTAAIGIHNYVQTTRMARANGMASLTAESRVVSTRVGEFFRTARDNISVVRHTPPIGGIARSGANGGTDPQDGSTELQWRRRLETIFSSLMEPHTEYTQVRFIGLANGGRELVRVNRTPSGFEVVELADLQAKGQEPYVHNGAQLAEDEIFVSPVSPNREHGSVENARTPTVRTVVPVFVPGDERFGMLVINTDFEQLMHNVLDEIAPQYRTILTTGGGHYVVYEPGEGLTDIQFAFAPDFRPHPVLEAAGSGLTEFSIDGISYSAQNTRFASGPGGLELGIIVGRPTADIMHDAVALVRQSVIVGIILVAASAIIALLLASNLTEPLRSMATAVRQYGRGRTALDGLPVQSHDEIGDLARAFAGMTRDLEATELTMKSVVDSMDDGLVVIDESGTIQSINPATSRIFGYAEEELLGRRIDQLIPSASDDHDNSALNRYCRTREIAGSARPFELDGTRKDGSPVSLELAISEIRHAGVRFCSALMRDISVRKQMETMKDEFVSTVNHELRTPLTSIHGALSLLKLKLDGRLDRQTGSLLAMAQNSCERLTHLVNDILDVEKIAAGKMEYRFEVLPADALVKDVVGRHLSLASQYNVAFDYDLNAEDIAIRVDPNRFNQALVNLLSNASKYSPAGGTVTISTERLDDNRLRISVADTGPGIPEDFRDKVFERFAQADSSATREVGGTGLGLNITRTLIQAFGGEVSFETEPGQGTTFHFLLPVEESDAEAGIAGHRASVRARPRAAK